MDNKGASMELREIPKKDPKRIYINVSKTPFKIFGFGLLAVFALTGFKAVDTARAGKIKCSTFATQQEAQMFYDSNPIKYKALDSGADDDNEDGNKRGRGEKACEHLPLRVK